jgi:hypothetical protein
MGTSGLTAAQLFYLAGQRGIQPDTIVTEVEQDSWVYNTTRNGKPYTGPSMVCCVFVCNMWKAGGLFEEIKNEVNCAELTNSDVRGVAARAAGRAHMLRGAGLRAHHPRQRTAPRAVRRPREH